MKVGIMQPYFFPYLGYFDLINRTDQWVVFDVVQYTPKTWMNRNRILHPTDGWQYVTVPVEHTLGQPVDQIRIQDRAAAQRRALGQFEHYRTGRAPHFAAVREILAQSFDTGTDRLRDVNVRGLRLVCEYVGIPFRARVLSQDPLPLPAVNHAGQWALEIAVALGADEYVNPPGGRALFDEAEFAARGVRLTFTDLVDFRYATGRYAFVEHLSILDVLAWNEPAAVKVFLDELAATRAAA